MDAKRDRSYKTVTAGPEIDVFGGVNKENEKKELIQHPNTIQQPEQQRLKASGKATFIRDPSTLMPEASTLRTLPQQNDPKRQPITLSAVLKKSEPTPTGTAANPADTTATAANCIYPTSTTTWPPSSNRDRGRGDSDRHENRQDRRQANSAASDDSSPSSSSVAAVVVISQSPSSLDISKGLESEDATAPTDQQQNISLQNVDKSLLPSANTSCSVSVPAEDSTRGERSEIGSERLGSNHSDKYPRDSMMPFKSIKLNKSVSKKGTCHFFERSNIGCRNGDACRYAHVSPSIRPDDIRRNESYHASGFSKSSSIIAAGPSSNIECRNISPAANNTTKESHVINREEPFTSGSSKAQSGRHANFKGEIIGGRGAIGTGSVAKGGTEGGRGTGGGRVVLATNPASFNLADATQIPHLAAQPGSGFNGRHHSNSNFDPSSSPPQFFLKQKKHSSSGKYRRDSQESQGEYDLYNRNIYNKRFGAHRSSRYSDCMDANSAMDANAEMEFSGAHVFSQHYGVIPTNPVLALGLAYVATGKDHNARSLAQICVVDETGQLVVNLIISQDGGSQSSNTFAGILPPNAKSNEGSKDSQINGSSSSDHTCGGGGLGGGSDVEVQGSKEVEKVEVLSYLTQLTSLTKDIVDKYGIPLPQALAILKKAIPGPSAILCGFNILKDIAQLNLAPIVDFGNVVDLASIFSVYDPKINRIQSFSLDHCAAIWLNNGHGGYQSRRNPINDSVLAIALFNKYRSCQYSPESIHYYQELMLATPRIPGFSSLFPEIDGVCTGCWYKCTCGGKFQVAEDK